MLHRSHRHRGAALLASILALALAAACLGGCLGLSKKVTVAATVGGTVISEEDVTAYIEGFRSQDDDRTTDAGWSQYLSSNGYTAESFRLKVLNDVFIPQASVKIQAAAQGIVVTDEELDGVIAAEKAYYEDSYGADSWTSVLASYGYDEESWRESEMNRLLQERLEDAVIGEVVPTGDDMAEYAPSIAPRFNGKHSYYIAFESEESAEQALASLGGADASVKLAAFEKLAANVQELALIEEARQEEEGEDQDPEAAAAYSPAYGMCDAGWGSLTDTAQNSNNIYTNALNKLELGTVSEVVEPEKGSWVIIYCDEAYVFQERDLYDLEAVPDNIREALVEAVADQMRDDAFGAWLKEAMKGEDIVINDMPSGLSYDVSNKMVQ